MPHSPAEKKRVTTRLRRIQGQALALERAVNEGTECGALLQQLAALRGAATGLMAEVLESHLRETFLQSAGQGPAPRSNPKRKSIRSCASSVPI
ncbi:metal-sensing transcriptional repressor [Achromobacter insuavis]